MAANAGRLIDGRGSAPTRARNRQRVARIESGEVKGGAAMEPQSLKLHLSIALKTPEIRRACMAVERILSVGDMLDDLPPTALEQVRDYCTDYNKGRKGVASEFKHAWIELVADHLNDARLRERRLFHGITGKDTEPLGGL